MKREKAVVRTLKDPSVVGKDCEDHILYLETLCEKQCTFCVEGIITIVIIIKSFNFFKRTKPSAAAGALKLKQLTL